MSIPNQNKTMEFLLEGISCLPQFQIPCFLAFLSLYSLTLTGNVLIISIICLDPVLQTPMYFLLCNLALLDISYSSVTQPKFLSMLLTNDSVISFNQCILQLYVFLSLASTEFLSLTAMAYDRYVAICNPLHYFMLMSKKMCVLLTIMCWLVGFLDPMAHTVCISQLNFCRSNIINHFYCDVSVLLKLSCDDTYYIEFMSYIIGSVFGLPAFILTLSSYVCIVSTIMKIHSAQGRWKTFSTCVSHLTVVIIFYGTLLIVYMSPITYYSSAKAKSLSLLYTVLIPLCNPLIYTLRNKDVKLSLWKLFNVK
ncbi:olfactory receptor 1Q1-like [Xenopus tropicalis]|uniref:Olfactory receptor n=1 Tax=Xenopus tropicalis TaxID=8364 RepID=A0A8J1IPR9_XENTR|nr:olfactory receptor 1Q1-like [Xenopus tropicalis]